MKSVRSMCIILVLFILIVGCAAKRPVLYPNEHMKQAGEIKAQEEIDACLRLAEESGVKTDKGKEIGKNTAGAAVIGGASGAAWGAFFGDVGKHAGAGAAAGAAGALAHGALRSNDPDVILRSFVERCLSEKGYEIIGWR
ncbi:MAG: hypothetical protein JRJ41_07660 [Deltaproteobacteria bacterium]|nr:hypothetical protein [Deltaproteobacteria bacterium]